MNQLARLSQAGSLVVEYGYAADGARLWKRKNRDAATHVGYYYHQDHLNSSSALSGSAGQQLEVTVWYPFGRMQSASPQATFQVSSKFTGQTLDAETGL